MRTLVAVLALALVFLRLSPGVEAIAGCLEPCPDEGPGAVRERRVLFLLRSRRTAVRLARRDVAVAGPDRAAAPPAAGSHPARTLRRYPPRPEALRRLSARYAVARPRCARGRGISGRGEHEDLCVAAVGRVSPPCFARLAGAAEGLTLQGPGAGAGALARHPRGARTRGGSGGAVRDAARTAREPGAGGRPRAAMGCDTSDFEVGLSQTLELGGRGGARQEVDEAALAREEAEAAEVERSVLREVRVRIPARPPRGGALAPGAIAGRRMRSAGADRPAAARVG